MTHTIYKNFIEYSEEEAEEIFEEIPISNSAENSADLSNRTTSNCEASLTQGCSNNYINGAQKRGSN